jgi:hypothetical protein
MALSLKLYNPVKRGGQYIRNITDRCSDWRHVTRRIGGWWTATTPYIGSREELDELFFDGLMCEVRAARDGFDVWQGFLGGMTYIRDGVTWVQSMSRVANAVKGLYTRIGDNLLTNGGAESGAWSVVNGATVTQSTEWINEGNYSCKIVVNDTAIRGADVQASLTIAAAVAYEATIKLNVVSGSWRIAINRTDTDEPLAFYSTGGQVGDITATLTIDDTNAYAGTVRFRITSEASVGTLYGDSARLAIASAAAETDWKIDTPSTTAHGRIDEIMLLPGMSYAAANAAVLTRLNDGAWPTTEPKSDLSTLPITGAQDSLMASFFGYSYTLRWRMIEPLATASMSSLVAAIVGQQSDYLAAGIIDDNPTAYQIDQRAPISLWKYASEIARAGDAAGARWALGVYNDRKLHYRPVSDDIIYRVQGGVISSAAGGAYEPHLAAPGWAEIEDAPASTANLSGRDNYITRRTYVEEVEYSAATDSAIFRREASD